MTGNSAKDETNQFSQLKSEILDKNKLLIENETLLAQARSIYLLVYPNNRNKLRFMLINTLSIFLICFSYISSFQTPNISYPYVIR